MFEFMDVLIIAALLLVPLFPASAIYYLLSVRRMRERARTDGTISLPLLGFTISFEAFGSTATYLVLLALAVGLFLHLHSSRLAETRARAHHGWWVKVPVEVQGPQGQFDADDPIYRQIQVSLQPFERVANNTVSFWVVKEDDGFPQVNLMIPNTDSVPVNLNDPSTTKVVDGTTISVSTKKVLRARAPYDQTLVGGGAQ